MSGVGHTPKFIFFLKLLLHYPWNCYFPFLVGILSDILLSLGSKLKKTKTKYKKQRRAHIFFPF